MSLAVGGFGLSGIPADLIEAVRDSGVNNLTVVSNNMGVDGKGLGILIEAGQVRKVIASYASYPSLSDHKSVTRIGSGVGPILCPAVERRLGTPMHPPVRD